MTWHRDDAFWARTFDLLGPLLLALLLLATPSLAASLSPAAARGKQLYTTGTTESGREVVAKIFGGVALQPAHHACVQCHGVDGKGGGEGGIPVPEIRWHRLTAESGIETAFGARRPSYDGASFRRALREGVDGNGESLYGMMPRFELEDSEVDDLVAYLRVIGKEDAPGVSDDGVLIGALLPADQAQGAAVAAVLERYFDSPAGTAPLHARRIELVVRDPGVTATSALEAARELVDGSKPVLAFLANGGLGADPMVLRFLAQRKVPMIGPLAFAQGAPTRGSVFYLLAGFEDQARAAARFVVEESRSRTGVLYARGGVPGMMRHAFVATAHQHGIEPAVDEAWGGDDGATLARQLQASGVSTLVLFGSATWAQPLIDAGDAIGYRPFVVASSVLLGGSLRMHGRALSTISPAVAPSLGTEDPQRVLRAHQADVRAWDDLVAGHTVMTRAALSAAITLREGLGEAGRQVTRERLRTALSDLRGFDTGMMPPITFGPNRRVGVRGALVATLDARAGRVVASRWIDITKKAPMDDDVVIGSNSTRHEQPGIE